MPLSTRVEHIVDRRQKQRKQRDAYVVGMTATDSSVTRVPPPAAYRVLILPVGVTIATVLVVLVLTIIQFDELLASARAADPSASQPALLARFWGRIAFGGLLAASWPLALRRLACGSTRVYARCRRVAVVAAVVLLAVTLFDSGPVWLHIAHGVLAVSEAGIFAATMHPRMRSWYAANRRTRH